MSQQAIDISRLPRIENARVAILISRWHSELVNSMSRKCQALLKRQGATEVSEHIMAGTLEFPWAARQLIESRDGLEAVICLSVVLKGDTMHFEMIVNECARGLGEVALTFGIPVINEVLPVANIEQARLRSGEDDLNKGIEAAAAAVESIAWKRSLQDGSH